MPFCRKLVTSYSGLQKYLLEVCSFRHLLAVKQDLCFVISLSDSLNERQFNFRNNQHLLDCFTRLPLGYTDLIINTYG